ncbi:MULTISPECIES: hexitol phosphatase HxpB [unclassified Moorena]|uniref:hexitol phosphatase HxpB n=1 Tax=unclassified Moorena TaxID=2683338 RepID=UPI00140174F9|nr:MULTISPECIES: hexitol phosphatase HxpB [unclassified Moorena]NEO16443.1 hexitol phosphatase HxpB [Moorena sp. SIO3E8]NEP99025.1 hexitol phosphatase HxpB [Moorena sp. SIO3F7]
MQDVAVIFDMDGLLIDSEPFWSQVEIEIFNDLGIPMNESMTSQTTGLRNDEVVKYWYARFPWTGMSQAEVCRTMIARMSDLLMTMGQPMPGAIEAVNLCRELNLPLALATSSPMGLIDTVLKRLDLKDAFDVITSAEAEEFGKPHPAVYLTASRRLGIEPTKCVALEDSVRGVISAKAASMACIAVPAPENLEDERFAIADVTVNSLEQITEPWLKKFLAEYS